MPTTIVVTDSTADLMPAQAAAAVACSRFSQVMNSAGLCLFGAFIGVSRLPIFEWLNAATGWQFTPQEYMQAGARIDPVALDFLRKRFASQA